MERAVHVYDNTGILKYNAMLDGDKIKSNLPKNNCFILYFYAYIISLRMDTVWQTV